MASLRVTVCELPDDPVTFPDAWDRLVRHVREARSDLAVLPELPAGRWFGHAPAFDADVWRRAVRAHEALIGSLGDLAPAAVVSSRPVEDEGRRLNRAFVWTPAEGVVEAHAKACLPDEPGFYEATWFHPGTAPFPLEVAGITVGMLLCTELMYPERARALGRAGVHLIAGPRATGGHDRWQVAVRMAAVVSGAYVVSANRNGPGEPASGVEFGGRAFVVSPEGDLLAETTADAPFATVEIEPAVAERAKATYPRTVTVVAG